MPAQHRLLHLLLTCVATFVSALAVMLVWDALASGDDTFDWATAVILAVSVGVSLLVSDLWHERRRTRT